MILSHTSTPYHSSGYLTISYLMKLEILFYLVKTFNFTLTPELLILYRNTTGSENYGLRDVVDKC